MPQPDLFAEALQPRWRPNPEKIRARLVRILGEARAAETMPWEPAILSLYRTIFPDMTRWLPDDEAARWRAEFAAELARLGAAAVSAPA